MPKETVRRQLQMAALKLFLERGYDNTTATDIAGHVGVTERTFFRYFPSKRDVLFDEAALLDGLNAAIAGAPEELAPMEVLGRAFRSLIPMFEDNRPLSEPARKLIACTPALQERHLAKTAATTAAVSAALQQRGVSGDIATLAAAAGMAIFGIALANWFADPSLSLGDHLDRAYDSWRRLSPSGV